MGFLADIFDHLRQRLANEYQFVQIGASGAAVEIDKHYLSVRLLSFRLPRVRNWGTTYHGAVHSFCRLNDITQGKAEYQQDSTPSKLSAVDGNFQDRIIAVNKTILDQVPYQGGLTIQAGLFSIKADDGLADLLKVVNNLSDAAGVAYLKLAQPFFPIIQNAADLLLGNSDQANLEIGVDVDLPLPDITGGQPTLKAGNYVLIQATRQQIDNSKLTLGPTDFALLDPQGQPVTDYPYMVIAITGATSRDNWMDSPELRDGWNGIRAAYSKGDENKAGDLLKAFRYTCMGSADLLTADGQALWEKAQAKFGAASGGGQVSSIPEERSKLLGELHTLSPFSGV